MRGLRVLSAGTALFFCCTNLSAQSSQADVATFSKFVQETYGLSLAYGGDITIVQDVSLIDGDRDLFLAQFESHPVYEVQLIGTELLLRRRLMTDRDTPDEIIINVKSSLDDTPIYLAAVVIANTSYGAYTNERGVAKITVPQTIDELRIDVQMLGYQRKSIEVKDYSSPLTISLTSSPIDVEEVLIEDRQSVVNTNGGNSMISIQPDQNLLSASNIAGGDVLRSLQKLPGIVSFEDNSSGIKIRGSQYDQTLVRIDDIPIYNSGHYFGLFSNINPLYTDKVDVYRNNMPISTGGRNGGLVDIKSGLFRSPNELSVEADINLLSSAVSLAIPVSKSLKFTQAGRTTFGNVNNTGFLSLIPNQQSEETVENFSDLSRQAILGTVPDFNFYDINGGLSWSPSANFSLKASYFVSADMLSQNTESQFNERRLGVVFNNEERFSLLESWDNFGASLVTDYIFDKDQQLQLKYYNTSYDKETSTDVFLSRVSRLNDRKFEQSFSSSNNVNEQAVNLNYTNLLSSDAKLTAGLDVVRYSTEISTTDGVVRRLALSNSAFEIVPYVNWSQQLTDKLRLNMGSRASYYSITEDWYASPRIDITYDHKDHLLFKGSLGRQYQFVRMIDFENVNRRTIEFWSLGGMNQIPISVLDHVMLGAQYKKDRFLLDVELYQRWTDGALNIALRNPQFSSSSILPDVRTSGYSFYQGTGKTIGADVMLSYTGRRYSNLLSYTWSKSTESFDEIAGGDALPAQLDRRHQFSLSNSYDFGDWYISSDIIYASGRPYLDLNKITEDETRQNLNARQNISRLPDYMRLDIGVGYQFKLKGTEIDLSASLVNLLGRQNVTYLQYTFALPQANNSQGTIGTNLGSTTNLLDRTLNLSLGIRF